MQKEFVEELNALCPKCNRYFPAMIERGRLRFIPRRFVVPRHGPEHNRCRGSGKEVAKFELKPNDFFRLKH